jgi:hypothetical protein
MRNSVNLNKINKLLRVLCGYFFNCLAQLGEVE